MEKFLANCLHDNFGFIETRKFGLVLSSHICTVMTQWFGSRGLGGNYQFGTRIENLCEHESIPWRSDKIRQRNIGSISCISVNPTHKFNEPKANCRVNHVWQELQMQKCVWPSHRPTSEKPFNNFLNKFKSIKISFNWKILWKKARWNRMKVNREMSVTKQHEPKKTATTSLAQIFE